MIFNRASMVGRRAIALTSSPLAASLSLTGLTTITVLILNLVSGIVQARALGPEGRGELTVAMLWPTLIAGVGGLGIQEAIVYYTAREGGRHSQVPATALAIGVPQTLALVLIGWNLLPVVLHGKPSQLLSETMFYLWFLPLYPLTLYPQAYLQGRMAMAWFNVTFICASAVSTAMLVVLWIMHSLTVHSALAASLASWALTVGLCFAILLSRRDWTWRPNLRLVRPLFWFGLRQQVGSIALLVLQQRLDLIVLSVVVPTAALGTYAVASAAGVVASTLPLAASFVLYPTFARQSTATLPDAMSRFLLIGGLLTLIGGPLLLLILPAAVPYVFGSDFANARPLTAILSLGYLVRGWNIMLAAVIRGAGRPFTASMGQAVEFTLLAGLLAIFIPRLGMTGAAAAVLFGAAASFILLVMSALFIARLTPARLVTLWVRQVRMWRHAPVSDYAIRPGGLDP